MVILFLSASHELLITFHKEFDDLTSENLPESQPFPSLDLDPLESSIEDTITDLGDHGMSLHQYLEGLARGLVWLTLQ